MCLRLTWLLGVTCSAYTRLLPESSLQGAVRLTPGLGTWLDPATWRRDTASACTGGWSLTPARCHGFTVVMRSRGLVLIEISTRLSFRLPAVPVSELS